MKGWKSDFVAAMEAAGLKEVKIKDIADQLGIKHISRQDCVDIMNSFCKRNPSYRPLILTASANSRYSLFTGGVCTEHDYQSGDEFASMIDEL